jgi:hypothetical protein
VERWEAGHWTIQLLPPDTDYFFSGLNDVSCTSETDCLVVGQAQLGIQQVPVSLSWDGTTWTLVPMQDPSGDGRSVISRVSCSAPDACTAVGEQTTPARIEIPLVERWDGSGWTVQSTPAPHVAQSALAGVSCPTATFCTAVGSQNTDTETEKPLIERWDGTAWTIVPGAKGS